MKLENLLIIGAAALLGYVAYKVLKPAAAGASWSTPSNITMNAAADQIYGRWPGVPYAADTTIPMQPGGGY